MAVARWSYVAGACCIIAAVILTVATHYMEEGRSAVMTGVGAVGVALIGAMCPIASWFWRLSDSVAAALGSLQAENADLRAAIQTMNLPSPPPEGMPPVLENEDWQDGGLLLTNCRGWMAAPSTPPVTGPMAGPRLNRIEN